MVVKMRKAMDIKHFFLKIKLNFETYKNCLEASQLENKMNRLQKK